MSLGIILCIFILIAILIGICVTAYTKSNVDVVDIKMQDPDYARAMAHVTNAKKTGKIHSYAEEAWIKTQEARNKREEEIKKKLALIRKEIYSKIPEIWCDIKKEIFIQADSRGDFICYHFKKNIIDLLKNGIDDFSIYTWRSYPEYLSYIFQDLVKSVRSHGFHDVTINTTAITLYNSDINPADFIYLTISWDKEDK